MNNASNRKEIAFGMFGFYITVQFALYSQFHSVGLLVGWLVRPMVDHIAIFRYRHIVIFIATVPFVVILWKMILYLNVLLLSRLVSLPGFISFIIHSASFFFSLAFLYEIPNEFWIRHDAPDCIHFYTQKINGFV